MQTLLNIKKGRHSFTRLKTAWFPGAKIYEDVRTGYYHADMPGRTEPYLITYDADSHVTDFH